MPTLSAARVAPTDPAPDSSRPRRRAPGTTRRRLRRAGRQLRLVDPELLEELAVPDRVRRSSRPVPEAVESVVAARRQPEEEIVGERDEPVPPSEDAASVSASHASFAGQKLGWRKQPVRAAAPRVSGAASLSACRALGGPARGARSAAARARRARAATARSRSFRWRRRSRARRSPRTSSTSSSGSRRRTSPGSLTDRLRALVEALGPDGGRADVEREHGRHAANLPLEGNGSRHRLQPAQGARRLGALRRRLASASSAATASRSPGRTAPARRRCSACSPARPSATAASSRSRRGRASRCTTSGRRSSGS